MISMLLTLLVPVAVIIGLVVVVVRRGFQMRQLALDGVEATGRVVAKLVDRPQKRRHSPARRIHYAYVDASGNTHENRSLVTDAFWDAQVEGGPIAIVYSKSQPRVSAPAHLVALAHKALNQNR